MSNKQAVQEKKAEKYIVTIGLEVHAQLLTDRKAFSPEGYKYGNAPNTTTSPVTLAHPGTLPVPNKGHFKMAAQMGMALNCKIHKTTWFARKNYFYPDLPKGYQITQHNTPLCTDGEIVIDDPEGKEKKVGITRIHLEEDSGKSIHDMDPFYSLVDLNRAGVPLIEIVTEPDMSHPREAYSFLTEMRQIVRHLEVCDGNMEEGSLRCDANISVRPKGTDKYGTKIEVKNLNSMRNVQRALEYEINRQTDLWEAGKQGELEQETRTFDAFSGKTTVMRTKEMAEEYRYFPEPDIPPVVLTEEYLKDIHAKMPMLPREMKSKFVSQYGLKEYDSGVLADNKYIASYFEELITQGADPKAAANWLNGPVRNWLNDNALTINDFPLKAEQFTKLIKLVTDGKVSFSAASQTLLPELINHPESSPAEKAEELNLLKVDDKDALDQWVDEAVSKFPDKAEAYRNGKKGVIGLFMGEVMKISGGKADPEQTKALLQEKLENG